MEQPWEESLDVNDDVSSLPSFSLRPCHVSRVASSPSPNLQTKRSLLPGPAGAVQATMHRVSQARSEDPLPTTQELRRVMEVGEEDDDDFAAVNWLRAIESGGARTPLGSIKKGIDTLRVARVVGVIKSCSPNGLGGLMLTLKDPTGTIGATIHQKVISEGEFGKSISVGAVLVLQKVAVFSPSRSTCYLNVTLNNIVKVISKDATEEFSISSVNPPAPISAQSTTTLQMPQETSLPAQSTQRIMNFLRQNTTVAGSEDTEKYTEAGHTQLGRDLSGKQHSASQYTAVEKTMSNGISEMSVREDISEMEHLTGVAEELKRAEVESSSSLKQGISGSANSTQIFDKHGKITGAKRPRQQLSITSAPPDYTEEQLNQFEFD